MCKVNSLSVGCKVGFIYSRDDLVEWIECFGFHMG